MIIPQYLKPGDRIRIVSPAGKVQKDKILAGIELLQEEGYEVIIGRHVFDKHFQYAGSDQQRIADLQEAINDNQTKAIVCARGGYGTIRLIDQIDLSPLLHHPKWVVGFSDITVLHSALNKAGIASIHGAMPGFFVDNKKPSRSFLNLMGVLTSGKSLFEINSNPLNRPGVCSGELVGGNLSLIYALQGTPFQLETNGKILIIEDLSEYLYHLDRMMQNLRLSGQLKNLSGLIVGGFTEMKDNDSPFGKTAEEIILEAIKDYSYPVCFDFPLGHIPKNLSVVIGGSYELNVAEKSIIIPRWHEQSEGTRQ
jgi:muramoyltetrapeptide carboxypeptidase